MPTRIEKGVTLLELLIVVTILVFLMAAIIVAVDPTEALKKSRDTRRMADLDAIKNAIIGYTHYAQQSDLDGTLANVCLGNSNTTAVISYSANTADAVCASRDINEGSDVSVGSTFDSAGDYCRNATSSSQEVDGTGWIPVNFSSLAGGSPVASLPVDPINENIPLSGGYTFSHDYLVYRYVCQNSASAGKPSNVFELNAVLESKTFASKMISDGGDATTMYEVGTSLKLLGNETVDSPY